MVKFLRAQSYKKIHIATIFFQYTKKTFQSPKKNHFFAEKFRKNFTPKPHP